jgi:hypothetical protein
MINFVTIVALLGVYSLTNADRYDKYGGWTGLKSKAAGFFRTENINGVWWLIDPEGNAFISKGVNHVSFTADNAPSLGYSPYGRATNEKYGDANTWAKTSIQRLKDWNFNTIGAWSNYETYDKEMPYTVIIGIGASAGGSWLQGSFPDVFSETFQNIAENKARESCAPRANDPFLLGYFLDNELRWGPDWRSRNTLFDDFLAMPEDAAGKKALVNMLKELYGDIDKLNSAWNTDCRSFDDIFAAKKLSDLGEEMGTVELELTVGATLKHTLPKELIIMYLNQMYGELDKVNEAFNTDAKSYDELLTPPFSSRITMEISKRKLPKEVIIMGLEMVYGNLDKVNEAFNTDAKSYDELLDELLTPQPLSSAAVEVKKVQSKFLKVVAEQYFKACQAAIRKFDQHHLILGCRYAGYAPAEVAEGMKDYVDVVSYNNYDKLPPKDRLEKLYEITGKPIMITEFSFKAMDSGLPNTKGAGQPVETQQDRADNFAKYVESFMTTPYAVGYHWFEHTDEPAEGRFDGENSNYGLVNIKDEPWKILVEKMTEVNGDVERVHTNAISP